LRKFEPERGLSELEALHAAQPDNRSAAFAYAAAGLAEGDARAVETMRALAKEDASWRVPVCARLVRYHDRIGDRAGANRWAEQLEVFGELEARAHATACNDLAAGRLEPTTHPAALIKILHAGFVAEPAVAKAWLVEGRVLLAAAAKAHDVTVRVDALILVVDPFDAERPSYDLDAVRSHQQSALSELIEPNALPVVMIFYATESLPAALEAALEQLPAGGTYVR
jgi:hypothetical protein